MNPIRRFKEGFRWSEVDVLDYKQEGSAPFRAVTRQKLFGGETLAGSCAISKSSRAAIPPSNATSTPTP